METLFGDNIKEIEEEWKEEEVKIQYGSIINDLMVMKWQDYEHGGDEFKLEGVYDLFRDLVHSHTVSGTLYHVWAVSEVRIEPGDSVTLTLSNWEEEKPRVKCIILKLEAHELPGMKLHDFTVLGERTFKCISKEGNVYTVV